MMFRILRNLITCWFFSCLFSSAVVALDDFEDGDHDFAWFNSNGTTVAHPIIVSGEYGEHDIKYVFVDNAYKPNHAEDKNGTDYKHAHFYEDYDDADYDVEGDEYWDHMFNVGGGTNYPERISGCTNKRNCHAYALDEVVNQSAADYDYWLNSDKFKLALAVDADSAPKANVAANNVLVYETSEGSDAIGHSTGVISIDSGTSKPDHLRWKFRMSGVYEMDGRKTFDTPMCKNTTTTVGEPMGGTWDWDEAGPESLLWPNDKVWQKDP